MTCCVMIDPATRAETILRAIFVVAEDVLKPSERIVISPAARERLTTHQQSSCHQPSKRLCYQYGDFAIACYCYCTIGYAAHR